MKLIMFIMMILLVSVVLFGFGVMVEDLETNYVDTGIVDVAKMNASYKETYSQATNISNEFGDIQKSFDDLSEQNGWIDWLDDVAAIPLIVISLPGVIFSIVATTVVNLTKILSEIGIPVEITILVGIALIVWIVIKLINFFWAKESV